MVRVIACPIGQDIGKSGESGSATLGEEKYPRKAKEISLEGVQQDGSTGMN